MRLINIDQHALSMPRRIVPIRRGILGPKNKGYSLTGRTECSRATMGAVSRSVNFTDLTCFDIHHFDAKAIELFTGWIGPSVINDPFPVWRPNIDVGKDVAI